MGEQRTRETRIVDDGDAQVLHRMAQDLAFCDAVRMAPECPPEGISTASGNERPRTIAAPVEITLRSSSGW